MISRRSSTPRTPYSASKAGVIAEVAVFLASNKASYINGQAIAVDGGLTSTLPFVPGRML